MNKQIPYIITLAAIAVALIIMQATSYAQTTDSLLADSVDQSVFPQITAQPVDQLVPIGSDVTLSVQANNAYGYQWLRNGVFLDGQTNDLLTIQNAGTNDVGLYSCNVFNDAEAVPTRAANVCVYITGSSGVAAKSSGVAAKSSLIAAGSSLTTASLPGGGPITVFGTPYSSGGTQGACPGPYAGYVNFIKTASQGWGWAPVSGLAHTASDDSGRTDTKVEYVGRSGDVDCEQTSVSILNPTFSTKYRFTIFFTSNVPTNPYPITLTGFNP